MDDQLFVIAIGGTGMRCLESFVHLCAIGMFDNKEINILTLDTDQGNGNKNRTETLINLYQKIKSKDSDNIDGGHSSSKTFFSAKINLYKFFTDYNEDNRKTYLGLAGFSAGTSTTDKQNEDLSDLFLDKETVQKFKLDMGYRAQTQLGSLLMYHSIIESARRSKNGNDEKSPDKEFKDFIDKLTGTNGNARVFVFGSVFGGTGASSIPIIPKALAEAADIIFDHKKGIDFSKFKFGATLLTQYFKFSPVTNSIKNDNEPVVADSSIFALNSQAAMQFYCEDPTIKQCYKRLYHVGWPEMPNDKITAGNNDLQIGGQNQKNDCHVVELVCACAAYDFFTREITEKEAHFYFRNVTQGNGENFDFEAKDFIGNNSEMFEKNMAAFLAFSHYVLTICAGTNEKDGGMVKIAKKDLVERNRKDYEDIPNKQLEEINDYLKRFAYDKSKNGWIYQIKDSVLPGNFLFKPQAFEAKENMDFINVFNEKKRFSLSLTKSPLINFLNILSGDQPNSIKDTNSPKEELLARIYNSIVKDQSSIKH